MRVGVLALQGDYHAHHEKLAELGASPLFVRNPRELEGVSALVLPGGESTTMLKLFTPEFVASLQERVRQGMPVLATCAGVILLAEGVENPAQESLGLLQVDVERNAYGRQVDSFIAPELELTETGRRLLTNLECLPKSQVPTFEGVFIRAPRITRTGPSAEVLATNGGTPVLVKQGNILGATFHPELSEGKSMIHQLLLRLR